MKKAVLAALFTVIAAAAAPAAGSDNTSPFPGADKGAASGTPSWFEGTWVGAWPGWQDTSASQDVTVRIERGIKEGVFRVEYSWDTATWRRRIVPSGTVTTKGREEADRFVFKWTNKAGNDIEVTLRKREDDTVKARMDRTGALGPGERPYNETILKRK